MRKLGQHLGVDPMAIYRHFQHREDLFDAVAELLFDHIDVNALPWNGRWRDLAGQYCQALLSVLQEHPHAVTTFATRPIRSNRSEEHTSELQSRFDLVCRLLLEKIETPHPTLPGR